MIQYILVYQSLLLRGIKIIYTVHGVQIKNPEKSLFYNILNFLFLKLTNQFVDQIVYISDFTKNGTQNLFEKLDSKR